MGAGKKEEKLAERREKRRLMIITAAQRVFLRKGIADTTMQDIATEADISRFTLYKYFKTKDALAFEVQIRVMSRIVDVGINVDASNTLAALREIFDRLVKLYKSEPDIFRYTGMFDHTYSDSYPSEDLAKRYEKKLTEITNTLVYLIQETDEGPIRKDLDFYKTAKLFGNTFMAMAQRMSLRGHILAKEQKIDPVEQIDMLIEVFLHYLKVN